MKKIILVFISLLITLSINSQDNKNLAELLGYPRNSKLLIIHADDMGLAHSVNTACIKAFENKGINSGSIMVPCPWAPEIASYVKDHPGLDVGVHLTMTAEWDLYKWGGVTSSDQISSLLDKNGDFYPTVEELGMVVKAEDARIELKSQIDKAIASGVQLTHIDTHMGSVLASPDLIKIYLSLSDEYHLPILFPRAYVSSFPPDVATALNSKIFLLDHLFMLEPQMITDNWSDAYKDGIEGMVPGLNQMIVHIAFDNDEMQAICKGHDDYGSAWRQNDLDYVLSSEFKDLLITNHIILVTWRQIRDLMIDPDLKLSSF
ncbi:MAG TPA: polysaccharide deacetylase family protein [Bacteroidales bacterium]|nr:polysaccharide deacetylase family protein [Bacteroidales bacterium]